MVSSEIPLDLELLLEIVFELFVDVVYNGLEAVLLVDLVAVADRVANGQLKSITEYEVPCFDGGHNFRRLPTLSLTLLSSSS